MATRPSSFTWPSMRGNPRNTGRAAVSPCLDKAPDLARFPTGNSVFSTPVLDGEDRIYVGSADRQFYLFDPRDGRTIWSVPTAEIIDSAACLCDDGTVVVPGGDGVLRALSQTDGGERWQLDLLRERTRFTPSTIYWWEANVVQGPDGALYAGNDDFRLYAVERDGRVRWSYLTGLHIWSACAFLDEHRVLGASFDGYLYCLDAQTGGLHWRCHLGNFPAASPAVGDDGRIYIGTFAGDVHAIDGTRGAIEWTTRLGGHVYGSCALSEDGRVLVGAADGSFVALDGASGRVSWAHETGEAIRASAAIGPDPEGRSPWLVYVGVGDGRLLCLTSHGERRWELDTVALRPEGRERTRHVNLNASVALGRYGLATASASGDVLYVPYDLPARYAEHPAVRTEAAAGLPRNGQRVFPVRAGGGALTEPQAALELTPGEALGLRVVHQEAGRSLPVRVRVDEMPERVGPYTVRGNPEGHEVFLVPDRVAPVPERPWAVEVPYQAGGDNHRVQAQIEVKASTAPTVEPDASLGAGFAIRQMAFPSPAIVPSFDQIGLASLRIDVGLIEVSPGGSVVAWGVQAFGLGEDGEAVGVPEGRVLYYPFTGHRQGGDVVLVSKDLKFEITAFPVPLDALVICASHRASGWEGRSLAASLDLGARLRRGNAPSKGGRPRLRALFQRLGGGQLTEGGRVLRSWFPSTGVLSSLPELGRSVWGAAGLLSDLTVGGAWRPWGLLDDALRFEGLGTFQAVPLPPRGKARVGPAHYVSSRHALEAPVESATLAQVPGLLVVDPEGAPVFLDYTGRTTIERDAEGRPVSVRLALPLRWRVPRGAQVISLAGPWETARNTL